MPFFASGAIFFASGAIFFDSGTRYMLVVVVIGALFCICLAFTMGWIRPGDLWPFRGPKSGRTNGVRKGKEGPPRTNAARLVAPHSPPATTSTTSSQQTRARDPGMVAKRLAMKGPPPHENKSGTPAWKRHVGAPADPPGQPSAQQSAVAPRATIREPQDLGRQFRGSGNTVPSNRSVRSAAPPPPSTPRRKINYDEPDVEAVKPLRRTTEPKSRAPATPKRIQAPICAEADALRVCNRAIKSLLSPTSVRDALGRHWAIEAVGEGATPVAFLVGSPAKVDRWYLANSSRFERHFDYFDVPQGPRLPRGALSSVLKLPLVEPASGAPRVVERGVAEVEY